MTQLDSTNANLAEISTRISDLQHSVGRLRHARFTGLALIFILGATLGAVSLGAAFWRDYRAAKRAEAFLIRFHDAGLNVSWKTLPDGVREVTVSGGAGAFLKGARTPDANGVVLEFQASPND